MRPKLGLVLEGGGALGLAHIGVITWMEEHRIPVSYVAGTSMGGLVGGIYATGRSPAEVRELINGIDWDQVLSGATPFSDLAFRRKQDAHEVPGSLEFGLRKGLQFPAGFNTGQEVDLILDRVALPYSELASFNDLPIPFACVATDLVSGKPHVFRDGPLSLAMRATMSLPGIFSPVRSGDHLYADGGLLNNIPIDVAKEMGADVILGIHLETEPLSPKATLPSYGVLGQSISVMIAANELRSMEQADILVTVPLQKYTALDYDKADAIIKAGYDAAAAKASVLAAYSVSQAEWEQYIANRNARRKSVPIPTFIQVTGTSSLDMEKGMEKQLSGLVGTPIDSRKLDQDMMSIVGEGRFTTSTYSMVEKNGQQGLQIQTEQKAYAPPIVRPLILIDGSDYNNVLFSIGARVTFLDFGSYRSELRNDVIVGSQYLLQSEYYHPFTPASNWFIAPRVGANSQQLNVYSGNTLQASYRLREVLGGIDTGYAFGRTGEFRLGYEGGFQQISPEIGKILTLPTTSGATGDVRIQYQLTTLDQPVIPRSGISLWAYTKGYTVNPAAPGPFPVTEIQAQDFFRLNAPSSIFVGVYGGSSYGYKTGVPAFSLGGSQRLVAWSTNELLTNQYFLGQIGYIRELIKLPPLLGSTVDFLGVLELGKTYKLPNGPSPPNLPMDVAAGVLVNTIFGPVLVAGSVGDYGHARFYFRIGRVF
ncbi:patatin-like phospholipase family protein [Tunturiibacter gelidoferens]|uniref:Patatin-like phospholipase family protein n=2 Tax=Tunturiibacter gelidiferens TaxID=3069689 RepID=A0AAU7Z4F0_9BACT|nr:patatin-like phospholipase family protein [Edaphobacter lichenicola]MBB5340122.1 NTE family protein [Edaphobacter lichenicola]